MLQFFARRLRELHEKDERGEKGFTLIELLVVVIIIGILAAIAIPVFLSQRDRAARAELQSDLRNMGAAATSCAAATPTGSYAGCDLTALEAQGYNQSPNVNVAATDIAAGASTWAVTGVDHDSLGTTVTGSFDIATGVVTITP